MHKNQYVEPELITGCRAIEQFTFPIKESVVLTSDYGLKPKAFLDVLNARRSERQFCAVSLEDLGPLFYLSGHCKRTFRDLWGARFERRNYASGGALHSIHCLVTDLANDTWYVYDAHDHRFGVIDNIAQDILLFKQTCSQLLLSTNNAWLIWYVCDHDRLTSRYQNADTVIFRESGHLSATHALVAEYLDLAYCPLGYHGFSEAKQLTEQRVFIGVGAALVGRPGTD